MSARWVADPCAMPLGHDETCALPGDDPHWDGCEPHRVHVPRCVCHGLRSQHGTDRRGRATCFHSSACACTSYEEKTP